MNDSSPRAPLSHWPVQLDVPGLGFVWYTQPATFVNQLRIQRATVDAAHRLHDVIDHVIAREEADIAAHGGLLILHDWRKLSGYQTDARRAFLDRMRAREAGYLRGAVAVVPKTPILRMAVQTANVVMALRSGGQLEMSTSVGLVLAKYGIQKPRPGPWR